VRKKPTNNLSRIMVFSIIAMFLVIVFSLSGGGAESENVNFNKFRKDLVNGEISEIVEDGFKIEYTLENNKVFETVRPVGENLESAILKVYPEEAEVLEELRNVDYKILDPNRFTLGDLFALIPWLLFVGVIIYFIYLNFAARSGGGEGGGGPLSMRFLGAKFSEGVKVDEKFKDVAGADEAVEEVKEVVDYLKDPKKYSDFGAQIPKGVLLIGPPGTGKTLLAKAVAGEASVPFFSVSGSEFVEMFVGVGASRVRDLFKKVKKVAPAIVFIDEIDAVGRRRGTGLGGSNDEREQTLNQLLIEIDGFQSNSGIIVIAATNRADILDPALLRPGRFDRKVTIDAPDLKGREEILRIYFANKKVAEDVDLNRFAARTVGFVGADLRNVANESALIAARQELQKITSTIIDEAIEKVLMGPEKKSRKLNEEEKRIIAFHEAGHAVVGYNLPLSDKIQKVSIVSRGRSLGSTWFAPSEDKFLRSYDKLYQEIVKALGGIAAEEIIFNMRTTGGAGDLQFVTSIAKDMITKYGMSEKIGLVNLGGEEVGYLGKDLMEHKGYSESTAEVVDSEVRSIVSSAFAKAIKILKDNSEKFELIARKLLEVETLDYVQFNSLMES
jgi:cell division protease FtsH